MATTQQRTYDVGGVKLDRPFKIRRLGHFGFNVNDMEESRHFYNTLLGFNISDVLEFAGRSPALEGVKETTGYFMHHGGDHHAFVIFPKPCLLYTSPSPRDGLLSRMPSSA